MALSRSMSLFVNIETDDDFEDEQRLFSGSNLDELTKIKEKIKSAQSLC